MFEFIRGIFQSVSHGKTKSKAIDAALLHLLLSFPRFYKRLLQLFERPAIFVVPMHSIAFWIYRFLPNWAGYDNNQREKTIK